MTRNERFILTLLAVAVGTMGGWLAILVIRLWE